MPSKAWLIVLAAFSLALILYFPFVRLAGDVAHVLFFVPVFIAAWNFGRKGGLISGFTCVVLFIATGNTQSEFGLIPDFIGGIAFTVIGIAAGYMRELHIRLKRESTLRSSVLKNSPIALFLLDHAGVFTMLEGEGLNILNTDAKAFLGINFFDHYRAKNRNDLLEYAERALGGEKVSFTTKDSTGKFDLKVNYSPFYEDESIVGMIGVVMDVTDLKSAELRAQSSANLACVGVMAGGLAHEINNPLAIISAFTHKLARVALESPTAEKVNELEGTISGAVWRVAGIVSQLRKIVGDDKSEPLEETALQGLVEQLCSLSESRFQSLGIDFRLTCVDPGFVRVRRSQISLVINNLLANAVDAVAHVEHPEIKLKLRRSNNSVQFSVEDNGPGAPEKLTSRIFDPFFSTKEVGKGKGLGLSVAQAVAKQHGGDLTYERAQNKTVFTVVLPSSQSEAIKVAN